jgi:hypothetical protein
MNGGGNHMRPAMLLFAVASILGSHSLPLDLNGRALDVLGGSASKVTVLIFIRTDCPISNRYAPEIQRLFTKFKRSGVSFWLVYPSGDDSVPAIRKHLAEYGYAIGALRDPQHTLVGLARVRVTPEAAIFGPGARLFYHGRIDDRYVDFGKARPAPSSHDLERAIETVLAGRTPPLAATRVIGCYIE